VVLGGQLLAGAAAAAAHRSGSGDHDQELLRPALQLHNAFMAEY
jgi:hypothetical protein